MKILIAGHRGQLGTDCMEVFRSAHEVHGADLPDVDLLDADRARSLITSLRPDVIVNCAAYTRVDDAEKESEYAACHLLNAVLPHTLAELARAHDALFVHISTDYVFDGTKPVPQPYVETDIPNPLCWYGRTKLAGEQMVQEVEGRYAILRTAWLYGRHGKNFPKTILTRVLRDPKTPLWVVNDQHGSPTWSWRLAHQIRAVVEAGATGLFHATSEGACTWYDFARELLACAGVHHTIEPCETKDYPTPARRPKNSLLENEALKRIGLNQFVSWKIDLAEFVRVHRAELLVPEAPR
jgi:dTDP-4-dehydrorhamnose reductase